MRRLRMVSQAIPGRPRSTVRLPLRGARHSWPPWPERAQRESLRIAGLSETVRGQKTPQKQRRRRKPVCAVERRRACARVSSADGTRSHAACADGFAARRLAVRITF